VSTRRSGLFSGRPDLLLVDERPPGITLPEIVAQAPMPDLEDDEDEADVQLAIDEPEEDDVDEDSYDGEGPLRIFIGAPTAAPPESPEAPPAPRATIQADQGPVWDASALAIGADEDLDDTVDDTESDRAPVLVRKGESIEPPPLTMSFGGSFSRGSMDAGVMDADGAMVDDAGPARTDTVVMHDQIYDRFLRFEDPTAPPPAAAAGPGEEDTGGLGALATGAAEDDSSEVIGVGDVASGVEPGPPPTRLRVGFVPDEDDDSDEWEDEDDDDILDDDDDDDDDDGDALDSLDRRLGEAMSRGLARSLEDDDDDGPPPPRVIIRDDAAPLVSDAAVTTPGLDDETDERPLVIPPDDPGPSRTAPDWAVRRRAAQVGSIRAGDDIQDDDEEEGGGAGLLAFVVVAILILVAAWWFYGREGATGLPALQGGDEAADQAPADQGAAASDEAPAAGDDKPDADHAEAPAGADAAPASNIVEFVPKGVDPTTIDPADLGILRVRATRPARIYIDGQQVGETPMAAISLPGGEHKVKAVAISSGRSRTQAIRVDPGRAQELRFTF